MEERLTVLVLCGGAGSRLRPATGDLPKALAPVGGRPFLHYLLWLLRSAGADGVVLCTGVGAPAVEEIGVRAAPAGLDVRISREPAPLGTGGAAHLALAATEADPLFIANGDTWVEASLRQMLEAHRRRGAAATMALVEVDDRARYGSVQMGAGGEVEGFGEKGDASAGWINGGLYLVNREVLLGELPDGASSLERDLLPGLCNRGLYGFPVSGCFIDIGTPASLDQAQTLLPRRLAELGGIG